MAVFSPHLEADTFLLDRSGASRSWEVTQVNEFLTQLEQFRGVFFATTNRMKSLDSAVLRRFSLKLEFGYLNSEQRVTAFRNYFTQLLQSSGGINAELSSAPAPMKYLTPGDFAVVRQVCQFQIKPPTQESLVAHLEAEMRMKPVNAKPTIGFR